MKKKKIVKTVPAILGTILLVDDDPILRSLKPQAGKRRSNGFPKLIV